MQALNINQYLYQAMIGTGGIGSGSFFALNDNRVLGREESRSGHFIDRRDYCKLHVVSHYVKILLGHDFSVLPVGKLGADEIGKELHARMEETGMDMQYVNCCPGLQTLFSFCFVYPDGSGGNVTTDNSACSKVDASFVVRAKKEFVRHEANGIVLAVPEVPMSARIKLLELGTAYGFFRVASFTSEEMKTVVDEGLLGNIDLLAVNIDEIAAVSGISAKNKTPLSIIESAVQKLKELNPEILVSATAGKDGSWCWDGKSLFHTAGYDVPMQSTAGAGDAHLSGIIAGLTAGLSLSEAHQLGALTAALSVTSPHTINEQINRISLKEFADKSTMPVCSRVLKLLKDD